MVRSLLRTLRPYVLICNQQFARSYVPALPRYTPAPLSTSCGREHLGLSERNLRSASQIPDDGDREQPRRCEDQSIARPRFTPLIALAFLSIPHARDGTGRLAARLQLLGSVNSFRLRWLDDAGALSWRYGQRSRPQSGRENQR